MESEINPVLLEMDGQDVGIVRVCLNRTKALNAIDRPTAAKLRDTWSKMRQDKTVHTVVITGSGPEAFCIGLDKSPLSDAIVPNINDSIFGPRECGLTQRIIVAVNGLVCREGFRFLIAADHVIAAPNAVFFDPVLDFQSTEVGADGRFEILHRGRLSAEEAHRHHLVDTIAPLNQLRSTAGRLARCPRNSVLGNYGQVQ
ncbi:enoyl-CoA hydratase/isomerase family protein [Streptomyces sp. NPDC055078]